MNVSMSIWFYSSKLAATVFFWSTCVPVSLVLPNKSLICTWKSDVYYILCLSINKRNIVKHFMRIVSTHMLVLASLMDNVLAEMILDKGIKRQSLTVMYGLGLWSCHSLMTVCILLLFFPACFPSSFTWVLQCTKCKWFFFSYLFCDRNFYGFELSCLQINHFTWFCWAWLKTKITDRICHIISVFKISWLTIPQT